MKKLIEMAGEMEVEQQTAVVREEQIRFILGEELELTGTSYWPERTNDAGKLVPASYSGWCNDECFRLLGESADNLNIAAPAWKQGNVPVVARGGQVVVLGTVAGKSVKLQIPKIDEDFIPSYKLNDGHLTGDVDVRAPKVVKFKRKGQDTGAEEVMNS